MKGIKCWDHSFRTHTENGNKNYTFIFGDKKLLCKKYSDGCWEIYLTAVNNKWAYQPNLYDAMTEFREKLCWIYTKHRKEYPGKYQDQ